VVAAKLIPFSRHDNCIVRAQRATMYAFWVNREGTNLVWICHRRHLLRKHGHLIRLTRIREEQKSTRQTNGSGRRTVGQPSWPKVEVAGAKSKNKNQNSGRQTHAKGWLTS
jgi:hypothetical protein